MGIRGTCGVSVRSARSTLRYASVANSPVGSADGNGGSASISVRATATTLVNASVGYLLGGMRLQASVLNLFDTRASDIRYYYASRLPGEAATGTDGIHFHPVEPRQLRISLGWGSQ